MQLIDLINSESLWNLIIRFFLNLAVLFILAGLIYYRFSKKAEYLFSFVLMGVMIFLICSILSSIEMQIGMALGLFAIFAIIRYRTISYSVKDMTYVFIIIGISIVNSQANIPPPILGAAIINLSVILLTYILELFLKKNNYESIAMTYENFELIKPSARKELLIDLSRITGETIEKVKINRINTRNSTADIEVFFKSAGTKD